MSPRPKPRRLLQVAMAAGAVLASLAVLLVIAAAFGYDVRAVPRRILSWVRLQPPVYRWVQSDDKTFSFLPGEGKAWGPIDPQQGEIHYSIRSFLPVDTGLMEVEPWADRGDAWAAMKKSSKCYQAGVRDSSKTCAIVDGKPHLIFIRDVRAKQFGLDGISAEAGSRAIQAQNSVIVTIFSWKCVERCR